MAIWLSVAYRMAVIAAVVATLGVQAQLPHIVGVWQLNQDASDVPDFIPLQAETRSYSLREDGYLVVLVVRYGKAGADFIQVAAKSDGAEYPEYRSQSLAELAIKGTATPFTYSETAVDDRTVEVIGKVNGQIANRGTRSVSEDGQTMTIHVTLIQGDQQLPIVLAFDRL